MADNPEYAVIKRKLSKALMVELTATKDSRTLGKGDVFDKYPYYGGGLQKKSI